MADFAAIECGSYTVVVWSYNIHLQLPEFTVFNWEDYCRTGSMSFLQDSQDYMKLVSARSMSSNDRPNVMLVSSLCFGFFLGFLFPVFLPFSVCLDFWGLSIFSFVFKLAITMAEFASCCRSFERNSVPWLMFDISSLHPLLGTGEALSCILLAKLCSRVMGETWQVYNRWKLYSKLQVSQYLRTIEFSRDLGSVTLSWNHWIPRETWVVILISFAKF